MPNFRFVMRGRQKEIPGMYTGPSYHERQTVNRPVRQPGFISDYLVPLFIAITGGALLTTGFTILYSYIWHEPERGWLPMIILVWSLSSLIFFIITQTAAWTLLWAFAEILTRKDLDKSGDIGDRPILYGNRRASRPDAPRASSLERNEREEGDDWNPDEAMEDVEEWTPDAVVRFFPIKTDESTMQWFVRVAEQIGTGSRIWEPILGRRRMNSFRDALIENGWANWRSFTPKGNPNPNLGWEFVEPAEEICAHIK
jgi:hypothetical protein